MLEKHGRKSASFNSNEAGEEINRSYKVLCKRLIIEYGESELNGAVFKESLDALESACKRAANSASFQDWLALSGHLKKFLKIMRPLDLEEILRLLIETKKGAYVIKDQSVILLIGKTGCGKSTTTHFLAGTKLKKVENNEYVVDNDELIRMGHSLKKVRISASANSETRSLFTIQLID